MEQNDMLDSVVMTNTPVKDLDGAGGTLAMGIISIPFCLGFIGWILAGLTLSRSGKALALYRDNPHQYTESSYRKIKSGRTCAIVSLSLTGFALLILLVAAGLN